MTALARRDFFRAVGAACIGHVVGPAVPPVGDVYTWISDTAAMQRWVADRDESYCIVNVRPLGYVKSVQIDVAIDRIDG